MLCSNTCDDPGHGEWGFNNGGVNPHGYSYGHLYGDNPAANDGECEDGGEGSGQPPVRLRHRLPRLWAAHCATAAAKVASAAFAVAITPALAFATAARAASAARRAQHAAPPTAITIAQDAATLAAATLAATQPR